MLIVTPQADRKYFRGMGFLFGGRRGLGQDDGGDDGINDIAIYDAGAVTNNQDLANPTSYTISNPSAPIVGTDLSPVDLSADVSAPLQPANTVLNALGVAVPKAGYTVSPTTGQVVPASTLTSAFASIPSSYWLLGGAAILGLAVLGGGKKRRR